MLTDATVKQACVSIPPGGVAEGFEPTSFKLVLNPIYSKPQTTSLNRAGFRGQS